MAPGKAAMLVSRLATLKAEEIAAETLGPKELTGLGLAPPRVVLRVAGSGAPGEPLAEVQLGVADAERGIAARRADAETVYWLDYDLAEHLPLSLEAFRNRFAAQPDAEEPGADEALEEAGPP